MEPSMSSENGSTIIDGAISMVETMSSRSTNGKWLERLTVEIDRKSVV